MEQKTGRVGGLEVGALCKCPFLVGSFLSEFCVFFFGLLDGFFREFFGKGPRKKMVECDGYLGRSRRGEYSCCVTPCDDWSFNGVGPQSSSSGGF